jgi:phosphonate utilization transcriptional regulator
MTAASAADPARPLDPIELVQSASLGALVKDALTRMILAGEIDAGAKLNEVALATRLGVSRGPVREAFRALAEAGLVRQEKNRGVFVREIQPEEAAELYELRAGLDEIAGRALAQRVTDAGVAELRRMVEEMDKAQAIGAYFPLNIRFHDRIVELAGNRKLLEAYRGVINQMHLMRRRGLVAGGGMRGMSNVEHRAIVDALARRDVDAVVEAMRRHVHAGHERLLLTTRPPAGPAAD